MHPLRDESGLYSLLNCMTLGNLLDFQSLTLNWKGRKIRFAPDSSLGDLAYGRSPVIGNNYNDPWVFFPSHQLENSQPALDVPKERILSSRWHSYSGFQLCFSHRNVTARQSLGMVATVPLINPSRHCIC